MKGLKWDMPPYSHLYLNNRQREIGDAIYEYARQNRDSIWPI